MDNTSNYEIINYVNDVSLENPQVLMTSDKNGNYTEAYTYGLDRISSDNLTADGKDNPLYYLYDGRGSVGQLINSSGDVKNSYSYDPFGVTDHDGPLGNSKAHYQDYFGFNGEEYNNISGMQYLRARYYEADSGRFLTRDSYMGNIMDPLSLNRYDYALNNPVMNIDPSGNKALAISDDGVAAIAQSYGMLRNGSSGSNVTRLQSMLSAAGFNPGTIDGIFGNNTEKAVRAYQASKGLSVDGIVGNQTWGALGGVGTGSSTASNSTALPTEILKKGSTGSAVQKLQQAFIALNYDLGPSGADGIFGNKTEQAVLNFQWSKNLSVDGIVGSQTWGALLGQGKACDGKDYASSQGTGNAGHSTKSTYNNTASADEIITIMSNRGYPITYTKGQWEVAGEIIAAGAVIEMIASITDLYVAGGLAALKDKLLSVFNKGEGNTAKVGDKIGNLGTLVENPSIEINWGAAREHALNRMEQKGVTTDMFESWVKSGKAIQQDENTYLFLTRDGVAVISKDGVPQTAYSAQYFKDHIIDAITQVFGK